MVFDKFQEELVEKYGCNPIYVIRLMTKSGAESLMYDRPDGSSKDSGFPDTGESYQPGFYYSYEDAVDAMHKNAGDIRETCYNYGFILRLFPGVYQSAGVNDRTYFKWDNEKKGYYEVEEPSKFKIIAYGLD